MLLAGGWEQSHFSPEFPLRVNASLKLPSATHFFSHQKLQCVLVWSLLFYPVACV